MTELEIARIAELEKFISGEVVGRTFTPYAGASPECLYCGGVSTHSQNCTSEQAKKLLNSGVEK